MTTLTVRGEVSLEGVVKIEAPCDLPPGPVEGVLVVQAAQRVTGVREPKWEQLYGLGREIWQGVDVDQYLRESREDREIER